MKKLLQLIKDKEITIDCGNVEQSVTIEVDEQNYFEIELNGFLHDRDNTGSEHEYPSSLTKLEATINFTYLTIDGIELEWTNEQKLAVYEILNEKFLDQFNFVELNY